MADKGMYEESSSAGLAQEVFSGKLDVRQALERLRTRLLDLTMRNKLLNYRAPKGRAYQFVGEPDLNLVYDRLEEGKSVPLAYVQDPPHDRYEGAKKPEARVYAREIGISTTVDLPASEESATYRRVGALQVLLFPADLEKASRKISTEAHTVIEETGTNMLYLMFGFLEYYDSDDSDKAVLAPLLSMPVHLNRGLLDPDSRTYRYELSHSGEDINENFTLREKFRQQFRLELPTLEEDDTPEVYLDKIRQAVSKRKRWAVCRRLTLGVLSFGKLAIWSDLDPDKSDALLSSELLRNLFEGGRTSEEGGFHAEDYVIDTHADGELPLIYDADSSQHVLRWENRRGIGLNEPSARSAEKGLLLPRLHVSNADLVLPGAEVNRTLAVLAAVANASRSFVVDESSCRMAPAARRKTERTPSSGVRSVARDSLFAATLLDGDHLTSRPPAEASGQGPRRTKELSCQD